MSRISPLGLGGGAAPFSLAAAPHALFAPSRSILYSTALTVAYVGGLYLSSSTRIGAHGARDKDGQPLDKNSEVVVRARLRVVGITTAGGLAATAVVIAREIGRREGLDWQSPAVLHLALSYLGLRLPTSLCPTYIFRYILPSILYPLLATSIFYLGPIYGAYLDGELPFQRNFSFARDVKAKWDNVWGLRNYVVGPLTEELIFRSCITSLTYLSGASNKTTIFLSPAYFAIAHAHHAWETFVKGGRTRESASQGLLEAVIQTAYTGVFGWYANYLLLQSGSVLAPLAAHVFCNVMGLPIPIDVASRHPGRRGAIWTMLLAGFASFGYHLSSLTSRARFGNYSPFF